MSLIFKDVGSFIPGSDTNIFNTVTGMRISYDKSIYKDKNYKSFKIEINGNVGYIEKGPSKQGYEEVKEFFNEVLEQYSIDPVDKEEDKNND